MYAGGGRRARRWWRDERLIDLFGGMKGLRDPGLLESAMAQPQASCDGIPLHADIWEMAAAYAVHLCLNNPFIDGNKRIAAVAMGTLLGINGHPLRVDEVELYQAMIAVAERRMEKSELAAWLREGTSGDRTKPDQPGG